jgi:hypothetical protein
MNKASFMKRYNIFFESIGRNPTSPRIDADTLKWLPLMFIVVRNDKTTTGPHLTSSSRLPPCPRPTISSLQTTKLLGRGDSTVPPGADWNMQRLCSVTTSTCSLPGSSHPVTCELLPVC